MKRKYHGAVAVMAGAITLAALFVYVGSGLWQKREGVQRPSRRTALNIKVPSDQQMRQMEKLFGRMHRLASPSGRTVAARPLTLFGYQDDTIAGKWDNLSERDSLENNRLHVSLTVLAGVQNYCIIDGHFLTEGARMDDGTQVLKIEGHRVLVAYKHERKWIYIEDTPAALEDAVGNAAQKKFLHQAKGQS